MIAIRETMDRLAVLGWKSGDLAFRLADGSLSWVVVAVRGKPGDPCQIRAVASTQADAWVKAERLAMAEP